jgi:hypothetical protein
LQVRREATGGANQNEQNAISMARRRIADGSKVAEYMGDSSEIRHIEQTET